MKGNRILSSLLLFLGVLISSCSSKQEVYKNKYGAYKFHVIKSPETAQPVVIGILYSYGTKVPLKKTGAIKIGDKVMSKTDENGSFSFKVDPGTYQFTGAGFPYEFCETKEIKLTAGDSLKLYIYLKENNRPIKD